MIQRIEICIWHNTSALTLGTGIEGLPPTLVRKQQEVSGFDQSVNSQIHEVTTGKGPQSVEGTQVARGN